MGAFQVWFDYEMQFSLCVIGTCSVLGTGAQIPRAAVQTHQLQGKKEKGFKRWNFSKELHIQHLTKMIQMLLNFLQLLGFMTYLGLCPPEDQKTNRSASDRRCDISEPIACNQH